ncbi:MAG: Minf_1886 family protein [Planctomycetota bacterium]|jgi:uncharacterized repeat protein (TIGR04138 family)
MPSKDLDRSIHELCKSDGRFRADGYRFVLDALDHTLVGLDPAERVQPSEPTAAPHNVSGTRLLDGFRDLALERFGAMAVIVLEHWGLTRTEDVGLIVFNLVSAGLLQETSSDSLDDYRGVYEFESAFHRAFTERLRTGAVRIPARREG